MSQSVRGLSKGCINNARFFSTTRSINHGGLTSKFTGGPGMPRKGTMPIKSRIPQVKRVVAVSSAKGGVGKSTVAANLAMALSMHPSRPKIGLLDLDIFGPSIPRIMGLNDAPEPEINQFNHLIPLQNHGIQCMSMGFLLSRDPQFEKNDPATETARTWRSNTRESAPVVWRGLMVQKATQQLLFEVDWSGGGAVSGGIDILVVDMPPGTGDVALTLGQLVIVDGAIIVSTAQDVALADVKKGVAMFQKIKVPMLGMLLNMSHYVCSSCTTKHDLFGSSASIENAAQEMNLRVLGKLPLVSQLSSSADRGVPLMLDGVYDSETDQGVGEIKNLMEGIADTVIRRIESS